MKKKAKTLTLTTVKFLIAIENKELKEANEYLIEIEELVAELRREMEDVG